MVRLHTGNAGKKVLDFYRTNPNIGFYDVKEGVPADQVSGTIEAAGYDVSRAYDYPGAFRRMPLLIDGQEYFVCTGDELFGVVRYRGSSEGNQLKIESHHHEEFSRMLSDLVTGQNIVTGQDIVLPVDM